MNHGYMSMVGMGLDEESGSVTIAKVRRASTRPVPYETLRYWNAFLQLILSGVAFGWLVFVVSKGGVRSAFHSVTSARLPA